MDYNKLYFFSISVCSEFGDVVCMKTGELLYAKACKVRKGFEKEYIAPIIQEVL